MHLIFANFASSINTSENSDRVLLLHSAALLQSWQLLL